MNELYVALSGAVVKAGTLVGVDDIDNVPAVLCRGTRSLDVTLPTAEVQAYFTSLVGTDTAARLAWGQEDGTAAPTLAAGAFTAGTSRTFIFFDAKVRDVSRRTTDAGPRMVLHLEGLVSEGVAKGPDWRSKYE